MIFIIHYTIDGFEDYFIVTGDTIEEIRKKAKYEEEKRGLTVEKNNLWSELI